MINLVFWFYLIVSDFFQSFFFCVLLCKVVTVFKRVFCFLFIGLKRESLEFEESMLLLLCLHTKVERKWNAFQQFYALRFSVDIFPKYLCACCVDSYMAVYSFFIQQQNVVVMVVIGILVLSFFLTHAFCFCFLYNSLACTKNNAFFHICF